MMGWSNQSPEYLDHSDEAMIIELAARGLSEGVAEMERLGQETGERGVLLCRSCGHRWSDEDGIRCRNCARLIGAPAVDEEGHPIIEGAQPRPGIEGQIAEAVAELSAERMTGGNPGMVL